MTICNKSLKVINYFDLIGSGMKSMLDPEWVKLILEAKKLGLTKEEVWNFFRNEMEHRSVQKTG